MCLGLSFILPYGIDVLALEEKLVPAIPLRIDTQARYVPLLQSLIHTSAHSACVSLPDLRDRYSTEVESNPQNLT